MGAVWVFDHRGEPKLRVQSCRSDVLTNVCFGGVKRNRLFMCGSTSMFSLYVNTQGVAGG